MISCTLFPAGPQWLPPTSSNPSVERCAKAPCQRGYVCRWCLAPWTHYMSNLQSSARTTCTMLMRRMNENSRHRHSHHLFRHHVRRYHHQLQSITPSIDQSIKSTNQSLHQSIKSIKSSDPSIPFPLRSQERLPGPEDHRTPLPTAPESLAGEVDQGPTRGTTRAQPGAPPGAPPG